MDETAERLSKWTDKQLKSTVATVNPHGLYGHYVRVAKVELTKRGVSFTDCISLTEA